MKTLAPALGLTLLLLAACGKQEVPPVAVPAAGHSIPPAPAFVVKTVAELVIHPERSAPAAVVGKNEARISAEVAATILALPADVGQTVKRGEIVARLDPRDAELALERAAAAHAQAAARHAQAQAQYERAKALREKNFYSAEALTLRATELASTAADLRAASAQRETARRTLDKHTVRAPYEAVVRARNGQVGELAAPGNVLMTLVSARELELAAQVQAHEAQGLADAVTPAPSFVANGVTYALRLLRVSPAVNREARSVEARFAFVAAAPPPGVEGKLVWQAPGAWLPADLLVRRAGRLGVFVASAGKAHFHALPEAQEGRPAPMDLPLHTQMVTLGRHALQDGAPLQ
jgi:RND family efflux transporter MFP subunit